MNYQELTFNYRSSDKIVHLCNSIQAVRASLFEHRSLKPQSTWQLGSESPSPVFFEKGNAQLENALRQQSDLVLIVPCEEGEEVEYVANDPYLKSIVQADDDGTPRNVLSAARAKGLEFLRVALYGWSQREEAAALADLMQSKDATEIAIDERLGLEYFLNNLYVAASRARRRLFVIDNADSRKGLWWFATIERHLAHVMRALPDRDRWQEHTGLLLEGVPESFKEDHDDPQKIAERFEAEGRSKEDSYLVKQASQQYRIAGDEAKADECRAVAELFDERFLEAGEHFKRAGLIEQSIDAYWHGRLYAQIAHSATSYPDIARMARCRIATFVSATSQTIPSCRSLFDQIFSNAQINETLCRELSSGLWCDALREALTKCVELKGKVLGNVKVHDAYALAISIDELEKLGAKFDRNQAAKLFFAAQLYEDVLKRLGADNSSDIYRDAEALAVIGRLKMPEFQPTNDEVRLVADYYFRQREFELAAHHYGELGESDRLLDCLGHALKESNESVPKILVAALLGLISNAKWNMLLSLLRNGNPGSAKWSKAECADVLKHIRDKNLEFVIVVPALARSETLSNADGQFQQKVSEYLADHFIRRASTARWIDILPRKVVGAAIERAGRDIDGLKFYESWRKTTASTAEQEYADRRWVICKLRQAMRAARDGSEERAANYRHDAEEKMEMYRWSADNIQVSFPDLSESTGRLERRTQERSISSKDASTQTTKPLTDDQIAVDGRGRIGAISYRLIPVKRWINIESDDGLCARILATERTVTSDDISITTLPQGIIECGDWGLRVTWLDDGTIRLTLGKEERDLPP
jgi:hypothetical protein